MGKDKLKRFIEIATFANVFEMEPVHKGFWGANYFKNTHPIVLELGCGRGEYTVNLAEKYPDKNFIGIDIKGARIWRGAKTALVQTLLHSREQVTLSSQHLFTETAFFE